MIEIPTITPWMIQGITVIIMIFVMFKILKVFEKKFGINYKELLDFNHNSYNNLKRKEVKLRQKRDRLADEVKLKTKIADHKEDIARYKKAKEGIKMNRQCNCLCGCKRKESDGYWFDEPDWCFICDKGECKQNA